jgi:hypothetical protein
MVYNGADIALNDALTHNSAKGGVVSGMGGLVSDTPV